MNAGEENSSAASPISVRAAVPFVLITSGDSDSGVEILGGLLSSGSGSGWSMSIMLVF
jgi:hypothetical protein